ncbi:MAG TPA: DNA repair protein RecN [Niabella sp.]|nr:DNA repair protein RecN [Niabella sp.]HOZ95646.1 DNA repair protein RecN [Niabella sp.]HQW13886.1 DNA repair protein RecN [Niabella sp.]HQX19221.1 DNA repair protein RecN [Niabella sp.]HQX42247.1 DNA repair protein RecN [Niabella sp.]
MLQHLSINNYAIINELEIDFSKGMNIITGETGAGKSIIIGALNLILGERADTSALVNKDKKCVIEGYFLSDRVKAISIFLQQNELDEQEQLVVRREISTNGKSRAFINDSPVNLTQLHELSQLLVDLHQQFDTLSLGDRNFQLNVIDALANNQLAISDYKLAYQQWKQKQHALNQLKEQQTQFEKESDYNQFQFDELIKLNLKEDELEEIETELKLLSNSEGIKNALNRAYVELSEGEQPLVQQIKSIGHLLASFKDIHKDLPTLTERLQSAQIELSDIAAELDHLNETINFDANRIEELNDRLSLGYKLQKKHGVQTTKDLLDIQSQLEEKLQAVLQIDDNISALEKEVEQCENEVQTIGEKISQARKKQIPFFEKKVNPLLAQVGMPNALVKISILPQSAGMTGLDEIEFLFDANKSGQFKPMSKVASGGELSRLMLCIKSLVAEKMDMPTLIFDEIDTGISGEAAKQVGVIMKTLAANRQIICITHQPQIAGKADAHYFVYKEQSNEKVATNIRLLSKDERITAIAKMLSGEKPTTAALENAREMVQD